MSNWTTVVSITNPSIANSTNNAFNWSGVASGNNTFVAVNGNAPNNSYAMTSTDTYNWTVQYIQWSTSVYGTAGNSNSKTWAAIGFGNGAFVAVSNNNSNSGACACVSYDNGVTWVPNNDNTAIGYYGGVAYGAGFYVAVGRCNYNGGSGMIRSYNGGYNWQSPGGGYFSDVFWSAVAFGPTSSGGPNYFVAVSNNTTSTAGTIAWSSDGYIWNRLQAPLLSAWSGIVFGKNIYVAVSASGVSNGVMTSPDGYTWTLRTNIPINTWTSIAYGTINDIYGYTYGMYVAVANTGTSRLMYSLDGIKWTSMSTPQIDSGNWSSIAFGNGYFVAVSNNVGVLKMDINISYTCFKEDTKILCFIDNEEKYIPIQDMKKGTLVKTCMNGYVPVHTIGTRKMHNPANKLRSKNRLYKCTKDNYPELTEDLIITGCHSILLDIENVTSDMRKKTKELLGEDDDWVTDLRYRLRACLDDRAEPYEEEGVFNIWHFALDHYDERMNYGVYANGLLVESCDINMIINYSGLELIE
jgi:hypothetical protein